MNTAILIVLGCCAVAGMACVFSHLGPVASVWILGVTP
jgi:hypothetical protein